MRNIGSWGLGFSVGVAIVAAVGCGGGGSGAAGSGGMEDCSDGKDNDCDGLIDRRDAECIVR